MLKNTASQKLAVYVFDSTTNLPKTGDAANLTAYVNKDYAGLNVLTDTSATEVDSTNAKGYYIFDLAQAETNADTLMFSGKSVTANMVVIAMPAVVETMPALFTTLSIDASGRVDMGKILGTAVSAPATAGVLDVNVKNVNNVSASSVTTVSANQGTTQPINFTGTAASALAKSDVVDIAGAAVSASTAQLGVNVVNIKGTPSAGAAGYVGPDWSAINAPTTVVGLTGTTVKTATDVETDTQDIQSRLPSALTSGGRMKSSLEAILDTAFTEGAGGRIAAAFKQFFNIATPAATMDHGILTDTVTTLTNAPSDSSGITTLLGKFTGITLLAQWLGAMAGKQTSDATAQTEMRATGAGSGTYAATTDSLEAARDNLGTNGAAIVLAKTTNITGFTDLNAAAVNAEVDTALSDYDGPTKTELDSAVAPLALEATLGAPVVSVSADIAAVAADVSSIKSVTDKLDDTLEDDGGTQRFTANALEEAPTGGSAPTAADIADAIWDEARAGHTTSGTFGQGVASVQGNVTGSAASVAGAVGSVTGNVGGNVTGSIGSLGAQAKLDVNAEADTAISDAALATASSLATVAGYVDTEVAAIKAKTDQLVFTTANKVDARAFTVDDKTGYGLADDAITAAKFDESTAFPLKSADTGSTAVARTGADGDTLETLSDQIDAKASQASVDTVDGNVDAIKLVTDKLDDTLEDDGGTQRFTANALEEAPSGGSAPTVVEIADEVETRELMLTAAYDAAKTAAQAGNAMALTSGERTTLAAAILDLANAIETGVTLRQSQRLMLAALAGKLSGAATTMVTIRNVGDSKDRITATVDVNGNRTAVSTDGT